jgi:tripartite ATP-independent transporter DctM subunit
MTETSAVIIMGLSLLFLLLSGTYVAFSLGIMGLIGLIAFLPVSQPEMIGRIGWLANANWDLTAVPMFVFMGELLHYGGISGELFKVLSRWMGRLPAGMIPAGIGACGVFAAISGSSSVTAATIGTVAIPEMRRLGYSEELSLGSLAAGGTLGILIPPSITMIVYASLAGVSIGKCFMAGLLPGILLAGSFIATAMIWALVRPDAAPAIPPVTWKEKILGLVQLGPTATLIGLILGGIYFGIMTPTEAGGVGAAAALILCIIRRRFSWDMLKKTLLGAVRTTSFIFIIVTGAMIFTYVIHYLGIPGQLSEVIMASGMPRWVILVTFYFMYVILGMFIDSISMIVMTVPIVLPSIIALGWDPIWFAVPLTICIEMGLITPPVGMNLYVLHGISEETAMSKIVIGVIPFFIAMLIVLGIISIFPQISLWLPSTMMK